MKRYRRKTASNKGRGDSAGTRKHGIFDAFLDAFPDKTKSRITHRRSPRVRNKAQFLTAPQTGNQFRKAPLLIMLMKTDEGLTNLQMSQKLSRPTGILGNDSVTAPQCLDSPQCEVAKIADRRSNQRQGGQLRFFSRL